MDKVFVEWKNYHQQFKFSLLEMRRTGDFCDVTLVCEDGEVQAHQLVLSTGSEVFSRMLKAVNTAKKGNQKVQLKGICKDELHLILDYIYGGQSVISQSEVDNFLKKGNLLGLVGFEREIEKDNGSNTTVSELKLFNLEANTTEDLGFERAGILQGADKICMQTNKTNCIIDTQYEKVQNRTNDVQKESYIIPEQKQIRDTNERTYLEENDIIFQTTKKSGTNEIEIETVQNMIYGRADFNQEKNNKAFGTTDMEEKFMFDDFIDVLGNDITTHGTKQEYQDSNHLTVLDVIIRNSITKKTKGMYSCNFCRDEFSDVFLLKIHMETYFDRLPNKYKPAMTKSKKEGQKWRCLDCGKVSPKNHMREHIEVHVSGLQYVCPDCKSTFKSKNNMRTHMIKSCKIKDWIKCESCNFKSHNQDSLDHHISLKHTKTLPLKYQTSLRGKYIKTNKIA